MYMVTVEKRDMAVKAKKLRKNGLVPCSACGMNPAEQVLFTIPEGDARKLLKEKSKGALVTLKCGEEEISTLIKNVSVNGMNSQIEDISFQSLTEGQVVSTVAKVVLKNKDKAATLVQMLMPEIPYKALPEHIVETVEVDLTKLRPGDQVNVGDLPICEDPNVELLVKKDRAVINVTINSK